MIESLAPTSRKEFFDSFSSDPAAAGFTAFLFEQPIDLPDGSDFSDAHIASLATFTALQTGNKTLFQEVYDELSRRQPHEDTPWLYNDPLIYGLVLGSIRFNCDATWIQNTLRFRIEHSTGEPLIIASTLTDILTENWRNETNLRPIILVARHLLGLDTSDENLLNSVYRTVTETSFPYYESNFLNAVYIRAFDVVVLSKAPLNLATKQALDQLIITIWKRSKVSAWVVWSIGLLGILGIFVQIFLLIKGLGDGPTRELIEILSLMGVPIVAIIPILPWVSNRTRIVRAIQNWVAKHHFGLDAKALSGGWPPSLILKK